MGARSRKRRRAGGTQAPPRPRESREERDERIRAELEPLKPGERPRAVTIGAGVAVLIAVANLGFLVTGWEVRGEQPSAAGVIGFSGLMLAAAYFMLQGRYWAVLGFQCLLAVTAVTAGLALLVASNAQAAVLSLAILVGSGTLFWFLVRALARLQMPERPGARRG